MPKSRALVNTGLCGTLDIAKTDSDRAGLQGHNGMQGRQFTCRRFKAATTGHDSLLIEEHQRRGYMGLENNFRARSLITEDHRLTLYEGAEWGELYDLSQRSRTKWTICGTIRKRTTSAVTS